jgi:hypothetical protein
MIPFGLVKGDVAYLSSLLCDLDANRETSVDGTAIATLKNWAPTGSANDFTAAGTAQPLIKHNVLGGQSAYRSDGVNDIATSNLVAPHTGYTCIDVFRLLAVPAVGFLSTMNLDNGSSESFFEVNNGVYQQWSWAVPTNISVGIGGLILADTSPHLIVRTYNGGAPATAGSWQGFLDGMALGVTASGATGAITGTHLFGSSNSVFLNMDLARHMVFSGVLTATQIANITEYLRRIYGF